MPAKSSSGDEWRRKTRISGHVQCCTLTCGILPTHLSPGNVMRPATLLITRDASLADRISAALEGSLVVASSWPAHSRMPWDMLIVDLAGLPSSIWQHLERSRHQSRPTVVLIDDGDTPRERLALVVADALIAADVCDNDLTERIKEHMWDHAFRVAARDIGSDAGIRHPLAPFLAAAFSVGCRKVGSLALALGFSESTVRSQWRVHRSDPSLRLADVLRRIDDIRDTARGRRNDSWHSDLQTLVESIRPRTR